VPDRKPYIVIREVGLENFEKVVSAHMGAGYLPIGGVSVVPGKPAGIIPGAGPSIVLVYVQAMIVFEAPRAPGS
jgi:hypothetical protein